MHEAFTLAGASHRGPVFVDVPMDEFFNTSASARPVVGPRQRLEPDGDAIADIAELLGQAQRPVLVLGTDVWADGAEEAALRLVEEAGIPVDHQRDGPRRHPRRPPAARDQGARGRARRGRPGRRRGHPARLPARLRRLRREGRRDPRARRTPRRLPRPGLPARRAGRRGVGRPHAGARRAPRRRRRVWYADPTGPSWVAGLQDTVKQAPPATPSCSARPPTRSTRPASTASWSRGWPTTRS